MKKFTTLMTVCSLVLAGAVMAQQPTPEESPGKKPDKKAPAELKPKGPQTPQTPKNVAPPPVKEPVVKESPAAPKPEKPAKPDKKAPTTKQPGPETKAPTTSTTELPAATATAGPKKEKPLKPSKTDATKSPAPNANASPSAPPVTSKASATPKSKATASPAESIKPAPTASTTPAASPKSTTPAASPASTTPPTTTASATPATSASASAAPSISQTSPTQSVNPTAAAKKPEPQKVEQIKQQHANFRAQPRPDRVPAVTFSANFRLPGVERWQGPQYEVYRSYRPERHDQGWYRSKYSRVELIGGGYYYFHNNYWYPAWGYSPREEYYAYDAPIYVGKHAEPPDKVIANVQAVLQEMGYYRGEVDGLLGPLTREALTGYQTDHGMTVTAVIDEPTLDSLGMG